MDYDPDAVKRLVWLCLPLQKAASEESFSSEKCPVLWESINNRILEQLKTFRSFNANTLHKDRINKSENECDWFSLHIYHIFQNS